VGKLFDDLPVRYSGRSGGYTRVLRTRRRYGDNAQMALVELVGRPRGAVPKQLRGRVETDWQRLVPLAAGAAGKRALLHSAPRPL